MKKSLVSFTALFLALFCLFGCVEEYPEPVFRPEDISGEDRAIVGVEDHGGISYTLYNDMTCHISNLDKENFTSLSLTIPSYYGEYVVVAIDSEVFRGADLAHITLPKTLKTIGDRAFQKSTLEEITLPDSLESIGEECFDNCLNLEKVSFGKNLTEFPLGAFSGCRKLKDLTLPEGTKKIGEEAFSSLSSLETLSLPNSLKEIGPYAFFSTGTDALEIKIPENVEKIEKDAFLGTAFLKNLKDEFSIVGKGVLLRYNGNATKLSLPEEILYLSNAFDESGVKDLTLNENLSGICENALEESQVENLFYIGSQKEVLDFVSNFRK